MASPKAQECYKQFSALRYEVRRWLNQCIRLEPPGLRYGSGDEVNYSLAWFQHYLITREEKSLIHLQYLKSVLAAWVKDHCHHGYPPNIDVHHGSEPFALYLNRYTGLTQDKMAIEMLSDVAEHIGNWVEGIPEWYDYKRHVFYSNEFGTSNVNHAGSQQYQRADHLRMVHIALAAYRNGGDQRYLDWAIEYGKKRARLLVDAPSPLPLLWKLDDSPVDEALVHRQGLAAMASKDHHVIGDPLSGIENLLASGAIYILGDLYALTGDDVFKAAADRIVKPLLPVLSDPYSDPAAAAVSYYRVAFNSDGHDTEILEQISNIPAQSEYELTMLVTENTIRRGRGVGRRKDMVYWGELLPDGGVRPIREPSSAFLALAYQLTGLPEYAIRAFKSAASRMSIARRVLRSGREHADSGSAISSIARGHGRNWGQGAVTGCYGPLVLGTREILGKVTPFIETKTQDDTLGLPENILTLVREPIRGRGDILVMNVGSAQEMFHFRIPQQSSDWQSIAVGPGEVKSIPVQV